MRFLAIAPFLLAPLTAVAAEGITIPMHALDSGASVGTLRAHDGKEGLVITPDLKQLPPGRHGFHVHEKGSCAPAEKDGKMVPGQAAGGHYDPEDKERHEGPEGEGHRGDLPALIVSADGTARAPVTAPRLKTADLKGRAVIIHAGGDNYADTPAPLGGGGARIACGVAK